MLLFLMLVICGLIAVVAIVALPTLALFGGLGTGLGIFLGIVILVCVVVVIIGVKMLDGQLSSDE
jgi:hypothetical protein